MQPIEDWDVFMCGNMIGQIGGRCHNHTQEKGQWSGGFSSNYISLSIFSGPVPRRVSMGLSELCFSRELVQ